MPKQILQPDLFRVDEDEAVELVLHHLRMASVFFNTTPDDNGKALHQEFIRLIKRENLATGHPEHDRPVEYTAVVGFINAITEAFEDLKDGK